MSSFYIDMSELRAIQAAVGATEGQFIAAYNKAMKQTANRLGKESAALTMKVIGAKDRTIIQRRVRPHLTRMTAGNKDGGGKIWFGLNAVPVSELKGRMKAPRQVKRKRDKRGRLVKSRRGARGATFTPKSAALNSVSFPDSFVGVIKEKKTIWIRGKAKSVFEARVPVYDAMIDAIGKGIFPQAGAMLLDYFSKDIRGRVAGGVHLNGKGKRQ